VIWRILNLDYKQENGYVITAWVSLQAQDDETKSVVRRMYAIDFEDEITEDFIELKNLTEQKVFEWVFQKIDKEKQEEAIQIQLERMVSKPKINAGLPWENTEK